MNRSYHYIVLTIVILLAGPTAQATECTAQSEKDLEALFAHFANPNDPACKIGALQRKIVIDGGDVNANGATTQIITLTKTLVVPENVELTSPPRISFRSKMPIENTKCLINLKGNDTINDFIVLNNSAIASENALVAVCTDTAPGANTLSSLKIVGGKGTAAVLFSGNGSILKDSRIKVDNGDGVYIMGNGISVLNTRIDVKEGTAVVIFGHTPTISGNTIYGRNSFRFQSAPPLKRSDAANIIKSNPSLLYEATGELDEEFYAKDNFAEVYAKDGFTGDLTYCTSPNGDPYYKPGLDSLVCNPAPPAVVKEELKCPVPETVACPLSGKLENGVCVVEKVVKVIEQLGDIGKNGEPPPLNPIKPNATDGGGSCSLVMGDLPRTSVPAGLLILAAALAVVGLSRLRAAPKRIRKK